MPERLRNIISDFTGLPISDITVSSSLMGSLELNSIEVANLVVKIEDEFNMEINDSMIGRIQTVGDILKLLPTEEVG